MKFIGYPIKKVEEDKNRPFWSVMIPSYNTSKYLVETLQCVLAQDPGKEQMQIMVVDDHSTKGNIEEIVKEIGGGRIEFYRQPKNLGQTGNWNTCLNLAKGYWIHLLHDDDLVLPSFYSKLEPALKENTELGAAFCRFQIMNTEGKVFDILPSELETSGILENWVDKIAIDSKIQPPSIVVKREVYEKLGGFHPDLPHTADWEMWQRIANFYPFWYETEVLASYRENPMKGFKKAAEDIIMFRRSIEIAESYLPPEKELSEKAKVFWAMFAVRRAYRMWLNKELEATGNLLKEGLNLSNSPMVLNEWVNFFSEAHPYNFTGIPAWESLPGDFSLEKATTIQLLLKRLTSGCRILEIGAFEGRSSVAIASCISGGSLLNCFIPLPHLQKMWGNQLNKEKIVKDFEQILYKFGCRNQVRMIIAGIEQISEIFKNEVLQVVIFNLPCNYSEALFCLKQIYPRITPHGLLICNYYEMRYPGIIRAINDMKLEGKQLVQGLWFHQKN